MQARHRPDDFKPDVPPGYLSRASFLVLCDLSIGSYTSLVQRGQLPMMPPPPNAPGILLQVGSYCVRDEEVEWFDAQGWAPSSALSFIVAQMLMAEHRCSRDYATALARRSWAIHKCWPQITEAVDRIIAGHPNPFPDVLFAVVLLGTPDPQFEVGTLEAIARKWPHPTNIIAISITQAALTLRRRAIEGHINIEGFWETGR